LRRIQSGPRGATILRGRAIEEQSFDARAQFTAATLELARDGGLVLSQAAPDLSEGSLVHIIRTQEGAIARGEQRQCIPQRAVQEREKSRAVRIERGRALRERDRGRLLTAFGQIVELDDAASRANRVYVALGEYGA